MEGRLILLVLMAFVTPGMALVNGTSSGCPSSTVCVMSPPGCNQTQTCLFANVTNVSMSNATILSFTLAGNSSGNITLVLSEPSMNGSSTNFICGHNSSANNTLFFSSPLTNLTMINHGGSVDGNFISCSFNFTFANISSIFNTSDLNLLSISLSSSPANPTTLPTPTPSNGTASTNTTMNGTASTNTTMNGTASTNTTMNGTASTNTTMNGTASTNTTTTTTTTTLTPATTKPTGASVALHPYASLLLLSLVSLFLLQKV